MRRLLGAHLGTRLQSVSSSFAFGVLQHALILGLTTCALLAGQGSAQAAILLVDDDAPSGGDGASWATAYRYLQDAMAAAAASDGSVTEIWVAAGTYKPDRDAAHPDGSGDQEATFQLINGVTLRGGFAGNEDPATFDPAQRDFAANETILSGDLLGNDDSYENRNENSFYVVAGSNTDSTAVLNGITVTAGWGGMLNNMGNPTVTNCTFHWNLGQSGMFNIAGNPTVTDCTFLENGGDDGGGMSNTQSNPVLTRCTFSSNYASWGGGIDNRNSSPSLTDCVFEGNMADSCGGGMSNQSNSRPTMTRCTFRANDAGGLFSLESDPSLVHCTFEGNHLLGGMWTNSGNPTLTECTFTGNDAQYGGGGMSINGGNPTVTDCTFIGNTAQTLGGGMMCCENSCGSTQSNPKVIRCRFSGNHAQMGGAVACYEYPNPSGSEFTDCVFESNEADRGGGAHGYGGFAALAGCVFRNNTGVSGGGVCIDVPIRPVEFTKCLFDRNRATDSGGGLNVYAGLYEEVSYSNCTFTGNQAANHGGGEYNDWSRPIYKNCTFTANQAGGSGGGIYNYTCIAEYTGCRFEGNKASLSGGGIFEDGTIIPAMGNCTFTGNSAEQDGGAICYSLARTKTMNCLFSGNSAGARGGAVYADLQEWVLTNSTFSGNSGAGGNGLVVNRPLPEQATMLTMANCILRNGDDEIRSISGSPIIVTFSDVQGGWPGEGNIDADPMFADAAGGNLQLLPGSPCIDVGSNAALPADAADVDGDEDPTELLPLDLGGKPRVVDGGKAANVDMGAYEYDPRGDSDGDGVANSSDNCPFVSNANQEDADGDHVGDACDQCPDTPAGARVDATGCPLRSRADFDRDGDVDANDLATFRSCLSGSGIPRTNDCAKSDLDRDGDVDQEDFGIFQRCYSGEDNPADPDCAN